MTDSVRAIADAVLYEGYLLWPYRRSATKNQRRWTFGGVYPRAHSEGREDDPWVMRSECLLEAGDDVRVEVRVRFLHVVARAVLDRGVPVDELEVDGVRHVTWDEAVEREVAAPPLARDDLIAGRRVPIVFAAGREDEALSDDAAIVRTWEALAGTLDVRAERVDFNPSSPAGAARGSSPAGTVLRMKVIISNETPWSGGEREEALRRTFCSTHAVLHATGGAFVSQTDPHPELREAAEACRNEHCWPVLVGEPGERHTVLASPIILEDHPRIAPESPGDLFDGGEIDQMLVLNILSLTDAEKAEMRDTDPKAREILERTEALTQEQLMALHGTIREFGMVRR